MRQFEVPGELLDTVDLAASLDLDGHGVAVGVATQQVDRADVGRELPTHEPEALLDARGARGQQLLEMGLDAVLLQPGVDAEVVCGVGDGPPPW